MLLTSNAVLYVMCDNLALTSPTPPLPYLIEEETEKQGWG
jgi:hypothetical protein